ncbi:MAG: hypothetical protein RLZZ324_1062 [Candidatus Parcubacteria bacterium]
MESKAAWERFKTLTKEMADLGAAACLLGIDQAIDMPEKGAERRAEVCGTIAGLFHRLFVAPEYGAAIDALLADPSALPPGWKEVIENAKEELELEKKLTEEFVNAQAAACMACEHQWELAKEASDYSLFLPSFAEVVRYAREAAKLQQPEMPPYDSYLNEYEDGLTMEMVERVLGPVETAMRGLLARLEGVRPVDKVLLAATVQRQREIGRGIAEAFGFDFEGGVLAVSEHPFTAQVHRGDVRITTNYKPEDAMDSALTVAHETGHGLYEQGLPPEFAFVSEGEAASWAQHEAISKTYENMVGRGMPFLTWFFRTFFNTQDEQTAKRHFLAVNAVTTPSFIRIQADQIHYPLHIILRTRLEKRLMEGTLEPADLPAAWNALFTEMFGYAPPDDAHGVLQDSHWSAGMFGYFPCYTLGDIRSVQLYEAAKLAIPGLEEGFARGEFLPLRDWLRENVFKHGATMTAEEIMVLATGKGTDPAAYIAHLTARFEEVHGLEPLAVPDAAPVAIPVAAPVAAADAVSEVMTEAVPQPVLEPVSESVPEPELVR